MANYIGIATDEHAVASLVTADPGSTVIKGLARITQTLTPASVAAATCAEQNFTVPGLKVGDAVSLTPPSITAGVAAACCRVSAANTLTVTFINPTAGALVPAAGAYQIQMIR